MAYSMDEKQYMQKQIPSGSFASCKVVSDADDNDCEGVPIMMVTIHVEATNTCYISLEPKKRVSI